MYRFTTTMRASLQPMEIKRRVLSLFHEIIQVSNPTKPIKYIDCFDAIMQLIERNKEIELKKSFITIMVIIHEPENDQMPHSKDCFTLNLWKRYGIIAKREESIDTEMFNI